LAEIFYYYFYDKDKIAQPKYEDPEVQRLTALYSTQIEEFRKKLLKREKEEWSHILTWFDDYRLYCSTGKGKKEGVARGRFYLNIKQEHIVDLFDQVIEAFRSSYIVRSIINIPRQPMRGGASIMKFTVEDESERTVLEILGELYSKNPSAFDEDTPLFTLAARDLSGKKMTGIGFSESPPSGKSFEFTRAEILAKVYIKARNSGLSVFDPKFDFEKAFSDACLEYGVDPKEPAFNLYRVASPREIFFWIRVLDRAAKERREF